MLTEPFALHPFESEAVASIVHEALVSKSAADGFTQIELVAPLYGVTQSSLKRIASPPTTDQLKAATKGFSP